MNYSYFDTNAASCWFSNNSGTTNSSLNSAGTNFSNLASFNGSNTWTVYCNDSTGNMASQSVTFNKLIPTFSLNWIYPTQNLSVTKNSFFNFTINLSCLQGNCAPLNVTLSGSGGGSYNSCGEALAAGNSIDGTYTICTNSSNCNTVFCNMSNGGFASIFRLDSNLTLNDTACMFSYSNDDHDSVIMWKDYSTKIANGQTSSTSTQSWFTWMRNNTTNTTAGYLSDRPSGMGGNSRPVPLPAADKVVWFDYETSKIMWQNGTNVTNITFASTNITASNGMSTYSSNFYFITDGVNRIHAGYAGGRAVLLTFYFNNDTVTNETATVLAPTSWYTTEEDAFGHVLYTVNGRVFYYNTTGTFTLGGNLSNPNGPKTSFVVTQNASPVQPGLDFIARVDNNGSVWFGDWGHDNGGYFNCGNDQFLGVGRTNIQLTVNSSSSSVGPVSTTTGATPFYTTSLNPAQINLTEGGSQLVTWSVNATGTNNSIYSVYSFANLTSDPATSNSTSMWNITIVEVTTDVTAPTVALISPSNATYSTLASNYFSANFSENIMLSNATFYLWNSSGSLINTTLISISETFNQTNLSVVLPYNNIFNWNFYGCDNRTNCGFASTNRTFVYDDTKPYFTGIGNVSAYNNRSFSYDINATDDIQFGNFSINLTQNFSINRTTGIIINSSTLSLGVYWINVSINDTTGNTNSSLIYLNITAVPDVTSPNVTLRSPAANYSNSSNLRVNVTFNCSVTDNSALLNMSLYITNYSNLNFSLNQTTLISGNSTSVNWTLPLYVGNYTWNCLAYDLSNNQDWGDSNRTLKINFTDTTNPLVSFGASTTASGNYSRNYLSAQISASDSFLQNVTVYLYNSTSLVNNTTLSSSISLTFSELPNGIYYINASAQDSSGNLNSTATRTYILDTLSPQIFSLSPAVSYNTSESSVLISANVTDSYLKNCSIMKDQTDIFGYSIVANNTSVISGVNTTFNLSTLENRTHNWFITCYDAAGNSNSSAVTQFTIDSTAPGISIYSPRSEMVSGFIVYVSTDISDSLQISSATYNIINASNYIISNGSLNLTNGWDTNWNSSIYGEIQGDFILQIFANDSVGNNRTVNTTFTLDNVNPSIQFLTPSSTTYYYNSNFNLSVYVQDFILNYTNYSVSSLSNSTPTSGSEHVWGDLINISLLSQGFNNFSVYARDAALNSRNSSVGIYVDSIAPNLTIVSPGNNYLSSASNLTFSWIAADYISSTLYCNLTVNGTRARTNVACTNSSSCNITLTNLPYLQYPWNVSCFDSASNKNTSSTNYFIASWLDSDGDGIHDNSDKIFGNRSSISHNGLPNINLTIAGSDNITTFDDLREVAFLNGTNKIINFTFNFTASTFNLTNVNITRSNESLIVNLSGQLQADFSKTLFIEDNNFTDICVKDAEVSSISEISEDCDGDYETDLSSCINGSYSANGIDCVDEGDQIRISNLQHSAVRGENNPPEEEIIAEEETPIVVPETVTTSSGGGSSSGYIREVDSKNEFLELKAEVSSKGVVLNNIRDDKNTGIKQIELKVKNWVTGNIYIKSSNNLSDSCLINSDDDEILYRLLEVNSSLNNSKFSLARVQVGILKEWIYANNISEVVVRDCDSDTLDISYYNETVNEGIYDIYLNKLSGFAIFGVSEKEAVSHETLPNQGVRLSFLTIFLITLGLLLIWGIIYLIKHRFSVYDKFRFHSRLFDLEWKLRFKFNKH